MNNMLQNSEWIWYTDSPLPDSYGDFIDTFDYNGGNVNIHLSSDGDYTLYVNGNFASSNQYGDFEHYKIYDSLNITDYLVKGKNEIHILVWHIGINSSRYKLAKAGLIYSVECDGNQIAKSSINTLSRENPNYKSNYCKIITGQLGQSFLYDATKSNNSEYYQSTIVDKNCILFPRPIKKSILLKEKNSTILVNENNRLLIDLGEETVGLPSMKFFTKNSQKITVTWGEHIIDGEVRRKIDGRDFSFEYIAKEGENNFTNYMLRLGARYLEVFCEAPIELDYIGIIPQTYPIETIEKHFDNPLDQKIYNASVNTLKLCIMEHYVDTPWREQSLYAFDSKNQMLYGYKAFEGKNQEYARANLLLISKDNREDGILSITYPSGGNLAIPSFSLHYFVAVKEYIEATNDLSLATEVYSKLDSIIKTFLQCFEGGLIKNFQGKDYWQFYDWTKYMQSGIGDDGFKTDFMINALFVLALESFKNISNRINKEFKYQNFIDSIKSSLKAKFFNNCEGLFTMHQGTKEFTVLVNSIAILCGLTTESESLHIAEKIISGNLIECSLSMKGFKYDALLSVNKNYRQNIINEIRSIYKNMLDADSKTVWEVVGGAAAFANAGSLCHGWSALPIIYL